MDWQLPIRPLVCLFGKSLEDDDTETLDVIAVERRETIEMRSPRGDGEPAEAKSIVDYMFLVERNKKLVDGRRESDYLGVFHDDGDEDDEEETDKPKAQVRALPDFSNIVPQKDKTT